MKKWSTVFVCLSILLTATAFTAVQNIVKKGQTPGAYKVMEVVTLWKLLSYDYQPNRDSDGTWLEEGFRSKYAMAKKYVAPDILEATYGVPVFLKGPHKGEMNFNSNTAFGYYNPAFISKVKADVKIVLANPFFKSLIKEAYLNYFENMALTYKDAYLYLNENPKKLKRMSGSYLHQVKQKGGTADGSMQEIFREYADSATGDASWYEAVTAPSFWVRRSIDGTSKEIFELLNMIISEMEKE
ncbi:MAG: hypothetical protein KTR30_19430 [Saprospiraceae bacterium]|nr:hypothetical protein [Saprospiraceae bacterium]